MIREIHVFDMDGTLVDTHDLVEAAYRQAANELGIHIPPKFWGQSADEWHCPPELHARKQEIYRDTSAYALPAWAAVHFRRVYDLVDVERIVWTAASIESVIALQRNPKVGWMLRRVQATLNLETKRELMEALAAIFPDTPIHYYDDNTAHATIIAFGLANVHTHLKEEAYREATCES